MRSKIAQRIMSDTPEETKIFVRKYGDIVVRVFQLLKEKRINQKDLAERLDKSPSEISKWLNGDHNFTLRSLAKLEAELGEDIIYIPKPDSFHVQIIGAVKSTAPKAKYIAKEYDFESFESDVAELNPRYRIPA
jgi:transcriptional regulator with XRE-family HTH domain